MTPMAARTGCSSALERYREIQAAPVRRLLERKGPALKVLRDFFQGSVDALLSEDCKGCLMANTVTELTGLDEAVTQVCSASARPLEAALSGPASGEIPAERSPLQLARFLMNTLSGLAVTAKAARERKVLSDDVEVALAALDR